MCDSVSAFQAACALSIADGAVLKTKTRLQQKERKQKDYYIRGFVCVCVIIHILNTALYEFFFFF